MRSPSRRYRQAIDVLDLLDNSNNPCALNYRGYATRKLGHYYLKSVALDPEYPPGASSLQRCSALVPGH